MLLEHLLTVYVKKKETLIKMDCATFLIRNVLHFYGLPLDLCRKRIATLFTKHAVIFANMP